MKKQYKTDIGITLPEVLRMQRDIKFFLSNLNPERDRLTSYYSSCKIAERALFELEMLYKNLH